MKVDSFKEIIKKSALSLFKDKGLNNVSTRDLNVKLNISRSHMYHYYSTWEELKLDAIKYMLDQDIVDFLSDDEYSNTLNSSEKIYRFLDYHLPKAPSTHWVLYLEIWPLSARDQSYAELIHSNFIQWHGILESIISQGIDRSDFCKVNTLSAARKILAMIDGYSSVLIVEYTEEKREEFIKEIFHYSIQTVTSNE